MVKVRYPSLLENDSYIVEKGRSVEVVVSALANSLLVAETVEKTVFVTNSVRSVSGSLSETVGTSD